MFELFDGHEVGVPKRSTMRSRSNAYFGATVIVIAVLFVFLPQAQVKSARQAKAGPEETGERFKVIPDIQPINLEGKLKELDALGYRITDHNLYVVGTSFTLIFTGDDLPSEVDEDGVGK
jgi:hypothetical protein